MNEVKYTDFAYVSLTDSGKKRVVAYYTELYRRLGAFNGKRWPDELRLRLEDHQVDDEKYRFRLEEAFEIFGGAFSRGSYFEGDTLSFE